MNDVLCTLIDFNGGGNEGFWLGTVGTLVVSLFLAAVVRRWRREDEQQKKDRESLEADRAALEAEIVGLATRHEAECRERRDADNEEARARRAEYAQLGRDISDIRVTIAYHFGKMGKGEPHFGSEG